MSGRLAVLLSLYAHGILPISPMESTVILVYITLSIVSVGLAVGSTTYSLELEYVTLNNLR